MIFSNLPAQAGPPGASCSGPCQNFSSRVVTPQPPCATCASAWLSSQQKCFSVVRRELPTFQFVLVLSGPDWAQLEMAPSFSSLSHWFFTSLTRSPQASCSLGWGVPTLSDFSNERCSNPSVIPGGLWWALFSMFMHLSYWRVQKWRWFSSCGLNQCWTEGKDHLP